MKNKGINIKIELHIASYFGQKHCILTGSGTTAIYAVLKALRLPEKSPILYPDITCETALNAAIFAGLTPVFCDIDLANYNLAITEAVRICEKEDIKVIIPTHIFGNLIDIHALKQQLPGTDIFILEDAAQAYGGRLKGVNACAMGDASIISFGPGKILDCGGGGAILTNDHELAEQCREELNTLNNDSTTRQQLKHGYMKEFFLLEKSALEKGSNTYIRKRDELKIKYKSAYLFQVDHHMAERIAEVMDRADQQFSLREEYDKVLYEALSKIDEIILPVINGNPIHWRFSFRVRRDRDRFYNELLREGFFLSRLFPPLHREYNHPEERFPNACQLWNHIVNIKFNSDKRIIHKTAEKIKSFFKRSCE